MEEMKEEMEEGMGEMMEEVKLLDAGGGEDEARCVAVTRRSDYLGGVM